VPTRAEKAKRRAKAAGYCGEHFTDEEWFDLVVECGRRCLRCGVTEELSVDHVYPLSLGGPNTLHNLQVLCATCNSLKGDAIVDYRGAKRRRPWTGAIL
jgi:5-methylcytosine-specific restriction endonuclease McrA